MGGFSDAHTEEARSLGARRRERQPSPRRSRCFCCAAARRTAPPLGPAPSQRSAPTTNARHRLRARNPPCQQAYHTAHGGDLAERKARYTDMVNKYYDLATSFYEYGERESRSGS